MLNEAGFQNVVINQKPSSAEYIKVWYEDAEKYVVAANVTATKPAARDRPC